MFARLVVILLLAGMAGCAQAQSSYPVADHAAQIERESDRRLILETELQAERDELAKARAAFVASPSTEREADVQRHIENIKALQRELSGSVGGMQEKRTPSRAVVKAMRPAAAGKQSPRFWDPYNRAPEMADFSTTP